MVGRKADGVGGDAGAEGDGGGAGAERAGEGGAGAGCNGIGSRKRLLASAIRRRLCSAPRPLPAALLQLWRSPRAKVAQKGAKATA